MIVLKMIMWWTFVFISQIMHILYLYPNNGVRPDDFSGTRLEYNNKYALKKSYIYSRRLSIKCLCEVLLNDVWNSA